MINYLSKIRISFQCHKGRNLAYLVAGIILMFAAFIVVQFFISAKKDPQEIYYTAFNKANHSLQELDVLNKFYGSQIENDIKYYGFAEVDLTQILQKLLAQQDKSVLDFLSSAQFGFNGCLTAQGDNQMSFTYTAQGSVFGLDVITPKASASNNSQIYLRLTAQGLISILDNFNLPSNQKKQSSSWQDLFEKWWIVDSQSSKEYFISTVYQDFLDLHRKQKDLVSQNRVLSAAIINSLKDSFLKYVLTDIEKDMVLSLNEKSVNNVFKQQNLWRYKADLNPQNLTLFSQHMVTMYRQIIEQSDLKSDSKDFWGNQLIDFFQKGIQEINTYYEPEVWVDANTKTIHKISFISNNKNLPNIDFNFNFTQADKTILNFAFNSGDSNSDNLVLDRFLNSSINIIIDQKEEIIKTEIVFENTIQGKKQKVKTVINFLLQSGSNVFIPQNAQPLTESILNRALTSD